LLDTKNIDASRLYSHQAKAINALHAGKNVIISTSTSSGKSLVYQLPVVQALEADIESTALYVFPTKALAQDQKRALGELVAGVEGLERVTVATFDGDTPRDDRDFIREYANVVSCGVRLGQLEVTLESLLSVFQLSDFYESRYATLDRLTSRRAMEKIFSQPQVRRRR
jgi:superfamily II DNA/RNA helicase